MNQITPEDIHSWFVSGSVPQLSAALQQAHAMAQPQAAVVILEHLTRLCPDHINYLHQLAGIRLQLNLPQQALDACQKALKLDPENPDSLFNTGVVLSALKAHDAACDCYAKALQFNSRHYGALRNFPLELSRLGLNDQAQEASARACTLYADDAWMHFNAGELLLGLRKPDEAVDAYRRCIELAPHHAEAQYGAAIALAASGQIAHASTAQHAVLKLCPDIAKRYRSPLVADYLAEGHDLHPGRVWMHALFEAYRAADWRNYEQGILSFIALIKGEKELPPLDQMELAHHSLLFTQPMDAAHRRLLSQHIAKRVATDVELRRLHRRRRSERPTLRIGYLSPNFGPRPSTTLLGQLFSRHDRTRFEVFAYAIDRAAPTPEKENIAAQVDTFRELGHLPTSAIAQIICHDEIDVLIDLAGYNWQARPEILAYRPAPVQINYLDFMGTTGAPWIDYCLLDRTSMQASERAFWTEKVAYLPWVTHPCELPVPVTQEVTRNDVGLPPTGLVISVLHSPLKLEPWSVSVWADVMRQLPHSYVWFQYELPEQVTNLTACMESHGVAPERLLFFPRQARTHYLQCLALADLHLDTLVFNGHTTTIETLGVGVPVVTLMGDRVVSRMAGAMLQAHHLPELVASSVQEYVEIAVRLGSDEHWRQEIRQRIQNTEDSKLFNPELRVREIETAYEMMWARHQAGLPPEDFDVPEWSGNISGARS